MRPELIFVNERQGDDEATAGSRLAFDGDLPTVRLDDTLCDAQAETASAIVDTGFVGSKKPVEYLWQVVRSDSNTGVGNN